MWVRAKIERPSLYRAPRKHLSLYLFLKPSTLTLRHTAQFLSTPCSCHYSFIPLPASGKAAHEVLQLTDTFQVRRWAPVGWFLSMDICMEDYLKSFVISFLILTLAWDRSHIVLLSCHVTTHTVQVFRVCSLSNFSFILEAKLYLNHVLIRVKPVFLIYVAF